MSYIDASDFLPAEISAHTEFTPPPVGKEPDPLSQPESNPSVVMDIDASTAIDLVRTALSTDFTETRAQWIHLVANLLTDTHNSLCAALLAHPVSLFRRLLPNEHSNLGSINNALESLRDFFMDCHTSPDSWTTCMQCIELHHLPMSEDDWEANVINCQRLIQATRDTVVNDGVRRTNLDIEAWLAGQRVTAQDAAITHLVSDHAPDITQLISDPCVIKWSNRIKEAMSHHLDGLISEEASTLLTPSITAQLDDHRSKLLEEACAEACQEGQCLFHTQLQSQQSIALADAQAAFTQWKMDNDADFTAKREAARKESLWDLAAYKHALTVEAEEQKEHACLESIKGVDHLKAAFARIGRKGHKPDPMGPRPSRSASRFCAVSPPPPSPSSLIALDKTPTKVDFVVGMKVDKDPLLPVVQAVTNLPISLDAQPAVATTCIGRMDLPLGVGDGTPPDPLWEDQRPIVNRAAGASPGEAHTLADNSNAGMLSLIPDTSSQVITPPSTTLVVPAKAESDEEHLMCIIGSTVGMALKPLRDDVSRLAGDVRHLTSRIDFIESADDPTGDVGAADQANWGAPHDINLNSSYNEFLPVDPSIWADRKVAPDNAEMVGYNEEYKRKCNEPHDWFFHLFTLENGLVSGSSLTTSQLSEVAILQDLWYDFCHDSHSTTSIPPLEPLRYAFWQYRQNLCAARKMTLRVAQNNLIYGNGGEPQPHVLSCTEPTPAPPPPTLPSHTPVSDHTWGQARPSVAQKEHLPVSLGDQAHDPILVSSDEGAPTPTPAAPWTIVGGRNGCSYAGVAAKRPTPPTAPTPPSIRQAQAVSITAEQLHAMTKFQVVNTFNLRFSPHITTSRHSKEGVIAAYLNQASRLITETKPLPALKPVRKMEYTLIRDPRAGSIARLSGC